MKIRNPGNIEEIQDAIINCAIIWAHEINQGNDKKANKQNSIINKIISEFKKDKDQSRSILVPLLQHPEPSVRLFASVHTLDQGIETQRSVQILESLANDQNARGTSLMAYINLLKWRREKSATMGS